MQGTWMVRLAFLWGAWKLVNWRLEEKMRRRTKIQDEMNTMPDARDELLALFNRRRTLAPRSDHIGPSCNIIHPRCLEHIYIY